MTNNQADTITEIRNKLVVDIHQGLDSEEGDGK